MCMYFLVPTAQTTRGSNTHLKNLMDILSCFDGAHEVPYLKQMILMIL